jgi:small-conductance mechanosensitive channel
VIGLLTQVALQQPHILKDPLPQVFMTGFGGGALNFEVRAWTDRFENWTRIRSELALAINSTLSTEKVAVR